MQYNENGKKDGAFNLKWHLFVHIMFKYKTDNFFSCSLYYYSQFSKFNLGCLAHIIYSISGFFAPANYIFFLIFLSVMFFVCVCAGNDNRAY